MRLGLIGLGKMGSAIARRVIDAGHEVIGFDIDNLAAQQAKKQGVILVTSMREVAEKAEDIWLMLPHGKLIDMTLQELVPHLKAHTIVIDGGNSKFTDSRRRAQELEMRDIYFLDCGTSGGLGGLTHGFCLMVGGDKAIYTKIQPLLESIAAPGGVAYVGPSGAGHYVKMVHNGIEYGLLQAYAEGFQLLHEGSFSQAELNLEEISRIWNTSSVIRSWILELAHDIFMKDQQFDDISGEIAQGGTGQWAVDDAHENHIPVPVIEEALKVRVWSEKTGGNYATKLIAQLRHAFGGHPVKKLKEHDENN